MCLYLLIEVAGYFCHRYAIGGLAGGEDKDSFWRVVAQCTASLPEDKPRYVMVNILNNLKKMLILVGPRWEQFSNILVANDFRNYRSDLCMYPFLYNERRMRNCKNTL